MKITEFENEQAIDLVADLIDPLTVILADPEVQRINASEPKLALAKYILKHHKEGIVEIMARLDGADPKTYKFNPLTLVKKLLDLLSEPEIAELFTLQR